MLGSCVLLLERNAVGKWFGNILHWLAHFVLSALNVVGINITHGLYDQPDQH